MIVEFAGIPKSGKTNAIDSARDYFTRKGTHVIVSSESTRACPFSDRRRFEFACWTANRVLNDVINWSVTLARESLVVQDRGIFDAKAFLRLNENEYTKNSTHDCITHKAVHAYLDSLDFWLAKVDLLFLFKANRQVVLSRDMAYRLGAGPGLITNRETLDSLMHCYDLCLNSLPNRVNNLKILDTSEQSPEETARIVCETIGFQFDLAQTDQR